MAVCGPAPDAPLGDRRGARFAFIVRTYERASGAFIHAALLGLVMGIGVLPGAWHAGARLAHLHLALLGWGGLTLLAPWSSSVRPSLGGVSPMALKPLRPPGCGAARRDSPSPRWRCS